MELPVPGTATDYTVDWVEVEEVDGSWEVVVGGNSGNEAGTDEHAGIFPSAGTYRVMISGDFTRIHLNNSGDRQKILDVEQWGDIAWTSPPPPETRSRTGRAGSAWRPGRGQRSRRDPDRRLRVGARGPGRREADQPVRGGRVRPGPPRGAQGEGVSGVRSVRGVRDQ
jgi:hypothetical protein